MNDEVNILGVNKETVKKSKDILPTLKLGSLSVGDSVFIQVLSEKPKKVEHDDYYNKGKKKETDTLAVYVDKITRNDGTVVEVAEKNTLWLSSESLKIGLSGALEDNSGVLQGMKVKISISMANYEQGENRCYNVSLMS